MKRQLFLLLFLILIGQLSAQVTVSNPSGYVMLNNNALYGVDYLVLFNSITAQSEITYTGTETVEWRQYDGTFLSNQRTISPDNATGYVLYIDGAATYYLWAIDYQEYLPVIESILFADDDNSCETALLQVISNIPTISYRDRNNAQRQFERDFTLNYVTDEYAAESWSDKT